MRSQMTCVCWEDHIDGGGDRHDGARYQRGKLCSCLALGHVENNEGEVEVIGTDRGIRSGRCEERFNQHCACGKCNLSLSPSRATQGHKHTHAPDEGSAPY